MKKKMFELNLQNFADDENQGNQNEENANKANERNESPVERDGGNPSTENESGEEKVFTQAEVDRIVRDCLKCCNFRSVITLCFMYGEKNFLPLCCHMGSIILICMVLYSIAESA